MPHTHCSAPLNHWFVARNRPLLHPHDRLRKTAAVLQLSALAKQRLEWFLWRADHQETIAVTCRRFGITPKTYHQWAKRYDEQNLRSLEDLPKAPRHRRQKTFTSTQYKRIVQIRRQFLCYGKVKLLDRYHQEYPDDLTLTLWQVQCIIQLAGLYPRPAKHAKTQAKRRRSTIKKRITELQLQHHHGFLFCLDTVVRYYQGQKRYIFTAIDRSVKLAFARMYPSKSSKHAADFLHRLHLLTAGKIENVGHDNGSEFQGQFAVACRQLNIQQYHSRVKTPKDNAVNERFNRTIQDEFVNQGNMTLDTIKFNQELTEWLVEYNFRRPHATLGYVSPINFIYKHHRLLPMTPSDTRT